MATGQPALRGQTLSGRESRECLTYVAYLSLKEPAKGAGVGDQEIAPWAAGWPSGHPSCQPASFGILTRQDAFFLGLSTTINRTHCHRVLPFIILLVTAFVFNNLSASYPRNSMLTRFVFNMFSALGGFCIKRHIVCRDLEGLNGSKYSPPAISTLPPSDGKFSLLSTSRHTETFGPSAPIDDMPM